MKKIILIGCKGVLGKFYVKELLKLSKILIVADIKIKNDLKNKKLIQKKLNVENEIEIKEFFKNLNLKYGKFDILINNAALTSEGIQRLIKKNYHREDFDTFVWDKTNNINLRGTFLACKHFIKYHNSKKINQKIINVGSIYGSVSPHHEIYKGQKFFSSLAYTSSKSGIIGLTKWLAAALADDKTTCNMMTPSVVYNNQNKKFLKDYSKLLPVKRMAKQTEIFGLLKFLISKDSDYITGQNIFVDGGFTIW